MDDLPASLPKEPRSASSGHLPTASPAGSALLVHPAARRSPCVPSVDCVPTVIVFFRQVLRAAAQLHALARHG